MCENYCKSLLMFQRHGELFEKLCIKPHTLCVLLLKGEGTFSFVSFHAGTKSDTGCAMESGDGKDPVQGMIIPFCLVTGVSSLNSQNISCLKSQICFWWSYTEVNLYVCACARMCVQHRVFCICCQKHLQFLAGKKTTNIFCKSSVL